MGQSIVLAWSSALAANTYNMQLATTTNAKIAFKYKGMQWDAAKCVCL